LQEESGMKKLILAGVVLLLLALDWAALHDILKQNEPNYTAEYAMLAVSILFFGAMAFRPVRERIFRI
jgi:hypothetical protein